MTSLAAVGAAVAAALTLGQRDGRRWGIRRRAQSVDANPYRGDVVHEESEQGAPWLIRGAASANAAWGVVTMLIFAPAGCLLFLMAGDAPLFVILLAVVVLSGFILSVRLMGSAGLLLHKRVDVIRKTVRWSLGHHLAVALLFGIGSWGVFPREPALGLLPSIPAAFGLFLAVLLRAAAKRAVDVERA